MAESDNPVPSSPPLPKKGSYNIDFDALDDSINPFESKTKLGSSPPKSSIPAPTCDDGDDLADPFKPRKTLASSPPGSPKLVRADNNNVGDTADKNCIPPNDMSESASSSVDSPQTREGTEDGQSAKESTQVTPKKKKVVKKPKAQSKFKPPKNLESQKGGADEIQILMPGVDSDGVKLDSDTSGEKAPSLQNTPSKDVSDHTGNIDTPAKDTVSKSPKGGEETTMMNENEDDMPYDAAPDAMASSSEIDQQFVDQGDIEEPDHANEGFAPATGACDGPSEWDMMEKLGDDEENKVSKAGDNSTLSTFDPLVSSPKEKLAKPSASPEAAKLPQKSDDDLLAVTPPRQEKPAEASSTKHPATRALEAAQLDSSPDTADNKKNSTAMDRSPKHEEGGDSKGAVVQLVQVLRYSQSDWNKMKQEMELNFQASLLNKERDWSLMLAERDKKIAALEESNRKVKHTNEDMRMVVAEFEKTISQLQAERERSKTDSNKTVQTLESERDQAIEDLQSVETAFSDLHRRYEKSKSIIEGFKRNEEQLKQCVEDLQNKLKKSEGKLQSLRSQAEEKLDKANEDIEKIKKSTKSDLVRLEAALKKAELRISSLEESLQRKEKENQELTAICDELIAKVGS